MTALRRKHFCTKKVEDRMNLQLHGVLLVLHRLDMYFWVNAQAVKKRITHE